MNFGLVLSHNKQNFNKFVQNIKTISLSFSNIYSFVKTSSNKKFCFHYLFYFSNIQNSAKTMFNDKALC